VSELQQGFLTVASAISATVLNALWQDALLVLCVWLLLRAWPRINAATRYAVWSATLVAAFVVPVATTLAFFSPATAVVATERQRVATTPVQSRRSLSNHRPLTAQGRTVATPIAALQTPARLPERARITLPAPVAIAVFAVWLVLAGYALARLAVGLMRLEQLKRDALPLPVEYRDAMPQWLRANKGARDVRLCVSDATDVPVAVGLFDAMILIPHSLLDRLSEPEVDQICLHELAHLRRADDWTNGLQRVINALLGWNPAALFVGQQLDLEREVACDDWVLSFSGAVRPYALCLTKMAESAAWPRHPIPAPGVFATRKHISLRIERLLGAGRNIATNLSPAPAAAAVAVVGAIALVIGLVVPSIAAPVVIATPALPASPVRAATASHTAAAPIRRMVASNPMASPHAASSSAPTVNSAHASVVIHNQTKTVEVPAQRVYVPAVTVHEPSRYIETPRISVSVPQFDAKALGKSIERSVAGITEGVARGAVAQTKVCVGCDYSGVNWSGKDLHGANYTGVDFTNANLSGVNFSGGSFNGADFSRANLNGASFRNAHLTGCDFSEANLSGADFTGASLSGCQFNGARMSSAQMRDVLSGCKGCDFSHAEMSGLDLRGVRISGDDFGGADLRNVNFAGAELVGTDFSNAKMDGINLAGATLNGCDLSGVDLSRVDLSKTKMIGMDLSKPHAPHR
jgi:uncharacterized protein YjbI with pentapeptide repeats/beta-lactamase regulating signal transducer with metallopeptidase domain